MIFQSNFLPCLAFIGSILSQNEIKINTTDQYRKQSYRNRAYILGPHQVETLVVPIQKNKNNSLIKDIKIDYRENWQRTHWRTITTCYKNSPFFEYYDYLFFSIFERKFEYLIDLNYESLSLCLKILKIDMTICQADFPYFENKNEFISFNAKNRLENVDFYHSIPYSQNFGNKFEPNLSIIDLIFNKGTESLLFLKKMSVK
jgi:hypothetical protein